jgi:hypothetical protein
MTHHTVGLVPRSRREVRANAALGVLLTLAMGATGSGVIASPVRAECRRVTVGERWVTVVSGHVPGTHALVVGEGAEPLAREHLPRVGPQPRCVRLAAWQAAADRLYVGIELASGHQDPARTRDVALLYRFSRGRLELLHQGVLEGLRGRRPDWV